MHPLQHRGGGCNILTLGIQISPVKGLFKTEVHSSANIR